MTQFSVQRILSLNLCVKTGGKSTLSLVAFGQDRRYEDEGREGRGGRWGRGGPYGVARGPVDRVQRNLRRAERFSHPRDKEQERFYNAQRHLSQLDRNLSRNKFDKDKLDEAIDDVKNVVEHNPLSPDERDTLSQD